MPRVNTSRNIIPDPPTGMEWWTSGTGQRVAVHARKRCSGMCAIHNEADTHMKDWPMHWRDDRTFMERLCEHDVGHPDPQQMEFIKFYRGEEDAYYEGIHGCDGCCRG